MGDEEIFDYEAENDDDDWECQFPSDCCMPSMLHHRSECYTPRMAEQWYRENDIERLST